MPKEHRTHKWTDSADMSNVFFLNSAQRLNSFACCVRLGLVSVGFRMHLKSVQFHSFRGLAVFYHVDALFDYNKIHSVANGILCLEFVFLRNSVSVSMLVLRTLPA